MIRLRTMLAGMLVMLAAGAPTQAKMEIRTFPVLAGAGAHDVYPAPDGAVWFTAQSAGKLGRLDPRTGKSDLIELGPGPLIGIPVPTGRGPWRVHNSAPAELLESGEAVGAPFLAADAVMHEEQPPGIIFLFQLLQPRVVGAPIGALPVVFEKAALGDVSAGVWRHLTQFVGSLDHRLRLPPRRLHVGLVTGEPGIRRLLPGGNYH